MVWDDALMDVLQLMPSHDGPPRALFAAFFSIWCFVIVLMLGRVTMATTALVQILKRQAPTDQKILWSALAWFNPFVGPILWWSIGSKQVGTPPRPPENSHERRD